MKPRGIIAFVLVAGLAGLMLYFLTPREPEYQGRPLSAWLPALDDGFRYSGLPWEAWTDKSSLQPKLAEAEDAIRKMGTNTVPYLLYAVTNRDSALKTSLVNLLAKQHFLKLAIPLADDRRRAAEIAFHALGPAASNAVPGLSRVLFAPAPPYGPSGTAASSLAGIGPAGWAALIQTLGATNQASGWSTACAAWALGAHHVDTPAAIAALMGQVTNTTPGGSASLAEWALGEIGRNAREVVPVLIRELEISDPAQLDAKSGAAAAIGKFGVEARSAVPALLSALHDPFYPLSQNARVSLKEIDPEAAARAGVK